MPTFEEYTRDYLNDPDSELFSSQLIDRLSQNGEEDFADDFPCIQARLALSIVAGTATYTLPDDVKSIRRITWLGRKLDPISERNRREVFKGTAAQGTPYWYIYNNIGLNQIKLYPSPIVSVASTTTDLYGAEIGNRVIVDYWKMPDGTSFQIPNYFRKRLLKTYVLSNSFNNEGAGQNLKLAQYFKNKYLALKQRYGTLLNELNTKPRRIQLSAGSLNYSSYPGSPVLPLDRFGSSVNTGE